MSRKIKLTFVFLLLLLMKSFAQTDFPVLTGPYLGQSPPSDNPKLFALGVISTGFDTEHCTFSPDGRECFYSIQIGYFETILWMRVLDGQWTQPEVAPFCGKYYTGFPSFHPDGSKLFFHSFRPDSNKIEPSDKARIWYVEKTNGTWGEPKLLGPEINGKGSVSGPSLTKDGTLYFAQWQDDKRELAVKSELINGVYQKPTPLPKEINATESQFHFAISPDESFLIIPIGRRDEIAGGGRNYYVSFKNDKNEWSELIDIGEKIRELKSGSFPSISADGKYFFFQARASIEFTKQVENEFNYADLKNSLLSNPAYDRGAIYWIKASFIEELRPLE